MQRYSVILLVITSLGLTVLGLVVLSSTSVFAQERHGNPYYFVQRQSIYIAIGLVGCIVASMLNYGFWRRAVWVVYAAAVVLLILCFLPGIGLRVNGASRWIDLGITTFQPSEFAKVCSVVLLAHWFTRYQYQTNEFLKGFFYPGLLVGVLAALIVAEVDLGATVLIATTAGAMMFVAGTRLLYILPIIVTGLAALAGTVMLIPNRAARIMAFTDLEKHAQGAGLQQLQGLIALGSGGVSGLGLGNGRQKMLYLPEAHTDFIFPMIGEELGLRITLLIVFAFILLLVCGMYIAINARNRFGMLMGIGVVTAIVIQAAVNIGVTTALLPNKGLPLPFISYGGSNLVICLFCVGILISIARQSPEPQEPRKQRVPRALNASIIGRI